MPALASTTSARPLDTRPSRRVQADGHLRATEPVSARRRSLLYFRFSVTCRRRRRRRRRVEGCGAAGGPCGALRGRAGPCGSVRGGQSLTFSHYLVTSCDARRPPRLISIYNASAASPEFRRDRYDTTTDLWVQRASRTLDDNKLSECCLHRSYKV